MKAQKGFTLIELIVVLCILGILALIVMSNAGLLSAASVPALKGPVNDSAGILSSADKKQLEEKLLTQERETSNQIVILTVESLDGEEPQDYATEVFNTWKLGQSGKDNGVLILHATADREVWIEVGYGLEGRLTDAIAGQIFRQEMVPRFKQDDFVGGYNAAIDAINLAVKGEFVAKPGFEVGQTESDGAADMPPWAIFIVVVVLIVVCLIIVAGGASGGGSSSYYSGSSDSGSSGGGYSGGGGSSGGGGAGGSY